MMKPYNVWKLKANYKCKKISAARRNERREAKIAKAAKAKAKAEAEAKAKAEADKAPKAKAKAEEIVHVGGGILSESLQIHQLNIYMKIFYSQMMVILQI